MRAAIILLGCLVALVACSRRADLDLHPTAGDGTDYRIFVGTDRIEGPDGSYGRGRSAQMRYMAFDVSAPPAAQADRFRFPTGTQVNPRTEFFATARTDYDDAARFRSALSAAIRSRPAGEREVILFVHGFNTSFGDGVLRAAQLNDVFDFKGVGVHFSWPSAGRLLEYDYDRDSVLFAREALAGLIRTVNEAGTDRLMVVGHSMGALLTMEALRSMALRKPGSVSRRVKTVVLISPDIDVGVFKAQARDIGRLPEPFVIFDSRKDEALGLSGFLNADAQRLGDLRNVSEIEALKVTVIDDTDFSKGVGHFLPGSSPALIGLLNHANELGAAFSGSQLKAGPLSAVALTLENATELVLKPLAGALDG